MQWFCVGVAALSPPLVVRGYEIEAEQPHHQTLLVVHSWRMDHFRLNPEFISVRRGWFTTGHSTMASILGAHSSRLQKNRETRVSKHDRKN